MFTYKSRCKGRLIRKEVIDSGAIPFSSYFFFFFFFFFVQIEVFFPVSHQTRLRKYAINGSRVCQYYFSY